MTPEPSRTWRDRLPLGLSLASMLLALMGLTPLGEAASDAARRVAFAERTSAVSGISASRTPRARHLVPLDASGRFPARVMPRLPSAAGPAGPAGPQGAEGLAGADGGRAIVVRGKGPFPAVGVDDVRPAVIEDLPPGAWALIATAEFGSDDPAGAAVVNCWIQRGITALGYGTVTVGNGPGATTRATLGAIGATQATAAGDIELICRTDGGGTGVEMRSASLSALRVSDLRQYVTP